jgi:chromosome segregation ATPase
MPRSLLERKLDDVASRLRSVREELGVVDEQLAVLADAAVDTRLRALVSETPIAEREFEEAQRHVDAMSRQRGVLLAEVDELERAQDELLDRLVTGWR